MTKTINRGFKIRFMKIFMLILNFFWNIGFSWDRKYFFRFLFLSESWADKIRTEIHPSCVTDCLGYKVRSNSIEEFTVPWIC